MINLWKKNRDVVLITTAILFCVLLTFLNYQYTKNNSGGNSFFVNWQVTRSFYQNGQNPYSTETTREIQDAVNTYFIGKSETEYRFSLPLYGIILYSPFALIKNFAVARALWMTVLEIGILAIILLSIRVTNWKTGNTIVFSIILFAYFGFHGIIPLMDGNFIILTTLLVICILYAIANHHDEAAGILLGFLTISLSSVILFVIYLLFWVIANHRIKVIIWFLGTFGLLIGFSLAIFPKWIFQFLYNFIETYKAIIPGSPGSVMIDRWGDIGNRFSIILSIIIGMTLFFEWWQTFRAGKKRFLWTAMLTLALSTWSGIRISPENFILLYPALFFGLGLICERWKKRANSFVFSILTALFMINWGIFFYSMTPEFTFGISSFLFIPLPMTVIFLLYWSKWWMVKAGKIDFDVAYLDIQKR